MPDFMGAALEEVERVVREIRASLILEAAKLADGTPVQVGHVERAFDRVAAGMTP